jgi:ubiquinone/menaquinone biosynthesis C-methylase UbiE
LQSLEAPIYATEPAATAAEDGGLRASLRAIWASVAPSWGELAEHVDTRGAVVAQAMLDSAGLQRGERVIELACGPGGLGMAAAAVVLSDIAPDMTAIAANRARKW